MSVEIFDTRTCVLGEGIFVNPFSSQIFWFDIVNSTLMSKKDGEELSWDLHCMASAAFCKSENQIVISTELGLMDFDLVSHESKYIVMVEDDIDRTRSNDGRFDPWGGFWFSSMGKNAEVGMASIYRWYADSVVKLFSDMTIPNSICFSKSNNCAYFSDTHQQIVWRQDVDPVTGVPRGEKREFISFKTKGSFPDGAVVDEDDQLWISMWGDSEVVCFDSTGRLRRSLNFPAPNLTCPLIFDNKIYVTSAQHGVNDLKLHPLSGKTFSAQI